eukprot:1160791-Pelagomonas_calceolata.AAC.15
MPSEPTWAGCGCGGGMMSLPAPPQNKSHEAFEASTSCCCYFAVQLAAECARGLSGVGACELTLVREQWSGGS